MKIHMMLDVSKAITDGEMEPLKPLELGIYISCTNTSLNDLLL